jgi:hypothetical protein
LKDLGVPFLVLAGPELLDICAKTEQLGSENTLELSIPPGEVVMKLSLVYPLENRKFNLDS